MRYFTTLAAIACLVESVASTAWIPNSARSERRNNDSPASKGFVTTKNGQFQVNGKPFFYFGTDAYWLSNMADGDINITMKAIAARNLTVVRTWAFNDVFDIPTAGAWFQSFNPNGTVTINTGANGLQRIDKILASAKANGLRVQLTLTNNWNPLQNTTGVLVNGTLAKRATNVTHPRGFLSNDYGGIDAYVRAHGLDHHDQFFANQTLINAFENYLKVIVPRYSNHTELLAWELANDPRCNSTLPASTACGAHVITRWHAQVSAMVKKLDPNHIVASGSQGFFCAGCPKIFPLAPRPQTSPAPGQKRRATGPLTVKSVLAQRRAAFKRSAEAVKQRWASAADKRAKGEKVRWSYRGFANEARNHAKRQISTQNVGPAFDGSQGIDSEDIINIPTIGFNTFQLFPDQNIYGAPDPNLDAFNNTIQNGINWITQQATTAVTFGKPTALTGFGLVTQNNVPAYTPFNESQPIVPASTTPQGPIPDVGQGGTPLTDDQQEVAYAQWIQAAIDNDISGITQYQWGQANLTPPPAVPTQNIVPGAFTPTLGQQNESPNDGYQAISSSLQSLFQAGAQQQIVKNS